jgi:hypothetical protein
LLVITAEVREMTQHNLMLIVGAAVVVLLLAGLLAWFASRRRQSQTMADRYGAHYERAVEEHGSTAKAEKELKLREKRFEKAEIRELSAADHERYGSLWRSVQARFVDSPASAVAEADTLVGEVMRLRGYPAADLEQRLADVALGHPGLVEHYRDACDIAYRSRTNKANTEDLRRAMVHYRALFEELLGATKGELVGAH